jgi:hypothetical protein
MMEAEDVPLSASVSKTSDAYNQGLEERVRQLEDQLRNQSTTPVHRPPLAIAHPTHHQPRIITPPPVGHWRDQLCDCCNNVCPTWLGFCCEYWCFYLLLAQLYVKVFGSRSAAGPLGQYGTCVNFYVAAMITQFLVVVLGGILETQSACVLLSIELAILTCFFVYRIRKEVRKQHR